MYWPLGAPKVFEENILAPAPVISDDGSNEAAQRTLDASDNNTQNPLHNPSNQSQQGVLIEATDSDQPAQAGRVTDIIGLAVSRNGFLFATITQTTLTVWQTKPAAVLTCVERSRRSIESYGSNAALHLRPDAALIVIQSSRGYMITYALSGDIENLAYRLVLVDDGRRHARKRSSIISSQNNRGQEKGSLLDGGGLLQEANLRFRMVIKLDAGVSKALALDDELIVATENPAAIQCIKWAPGKSGSQTSTELLQSMGWLQPGSIITEMVFEKPMSLFTWITNDGRAFAVQRTTNGQTEGTSNSSLFKGFEFHTPRDTNDLARIAAINSKFSLIALGCSDSSVWLYTIRDYSGGISFMNKLSLSASPASLGLITSLVYSPDGHCLFSGFERGWATWSTYGQPGAASFGADRNLSKVHNDEWLLSVQDAFWVGIGSELMILPYPCPKLYQLEFARSSLTGCFTPANASKALLQTSRGLMVYQGHDMPDLTAITTNVSLWQHVQAPDRYLANNWPLRHTVISHDGRYVAVAGQRGLAHYSIASGRWKTFEDEAMESEFQVKGGMCWHQHVLIVAVESQKGYELRLYSRDQPLDSTKTSYVEPLSSPVIHLAPSGDDSLLVYTHENILDHYVVSASKISLQLTKVGQIALHGIIRAPTRVRSISWIVPDHQLQSGDPSQDVAVATVLFLVDGKLVLLQPTTSDEGQLKYDMRVVAHNVEFYTLARDTPAFYSALVDQLRAGANPETGTIPSTGDQSLEDSLWLFDGQTVTVWPDVHDLLQPRMDEPTREVPGSVRIPVDFYPLTTLLPKGILFGVEAELAQRRDAGFALVHILARTTLFLPNLLQHHLSQYDSPGALHLAHRYQHLPYFAHALEILLHNVLDEEVETQPGFENSLLPSVLSFLSTFPEYLDIVVQCTRKTEVRSWRTLFAHLPPPQELFETSLERGSLKTAGGYLLVLHTLEEINSTSPQVIRLLRLAREQQDWELCKELARFLMALDESGTTLRQALELMEISSPTEVSATSSHITNGGGSAEVIMNGYHHQRP